MFLIGVEEVGGAQIVVRFDEVTWFEPNQSHSWRLQVFDPIHVLLCDLDLLATQRIVGAHHSVE